MCVVPQTANITYKVPKAPYLTSTGSFYNPNVSGYSLEHVRAACKSNAWKFR